jgi:adenine-specific DNA-methyltransferase
MAKTKLELTWIGKENRPRLEPRILLEDPSKSYHAAQRVSDRDLFDNRLIFGDNLLALKALEQEFAGKIKCVYIDPPYNTGSAFDHYDDGVEHSLWLSLMRDRLELLRRLLTPDGSIWISIDDNEQAYLRVLMDEVFGRANFVATVIWQKVFAPKNTARHFSEDHDFVMVFAKDAQRWVPNPMARTEKQDKAYRNPDNDPRGPWKPGDVAARNFYSRGTYAIKCPGGRLIEGPRPGTYWRYSEDKFWEMHRDNRIWWGSDQNRLPMIKRFKSEVMAGRVPQTLWPYTEVGHTKEAKEEVNAVIPDVPDVFQTTKPERLLQRIIQIATAPGEWVLDSFAGSGTTAAVAHKMKRRWITVELGEHCHTHVLPRLTKVVSGQDDGGVSKAEEWNGGGGFRYYRLAPSLLEKDKFGQWVVSKQFNAAMLAEAMCKLEGFTYAPSSEVYWQHGNSTERDFIYVTTQTLTREMLAKLSDEVGEDRSLLICCGAFRSGATEYTNLTLKKIPKTVMSRCEWGKDDYSLQIAALPKAEKVDDDSPPPTLPPGEQRKQRKARVTEPSLFGGSDENGNGGAK